MEIVLHVYLCCANRTLRYVMTIPISHSHCALVPHIGWQLYETELRVKQLEKCDCRLGCKWSKPSQNEPSLASTSTTTTTTIKTQRASTLTSNSDSNTRQGYSTTNGGNSTILVQVNKMDGEIWESNCDVCSCHVSIVADQTKLKISSQIASSVVLVCMFV